MSKFTLARNFLNEFKGDAYFLGRGYLTELIKLHLQQAQTPS